MQLPEIVFCWEDSKFKVCLGDSGHFSVDDEKLYTVTANDLKRNCVNLQRIKKLDLGPGISRISGSRAPVIDRSDELAKRLKNKK
jgi:hypothetical protein